jgi:hypothetical protein
MTNINPLFSNCYNFSIDRGDDKLQLFGQQASVPGLALNMQPQPTTLGVQIPIAVNTYDFSPLELNFIVDENIDNWKSIYDWMKSIGNMSSDKEGSQYSTWSTFANLQILKANYYPLSNRNFTFHDVIPVSLSALNFRSDISDTNPVTATVRFNYSYYSID